MLGPPDDRADVADGPVGASADGGGRAGVRSVAPLLPSLPSPREPSGAAPADAALPEQPQVVGPHPDDPHLPGMLPHPMDDARRRLYAENSLIQSLNDAMSFRNVKEMRALLVQYRELDPTDVEANQAGYAVIANCIESPGEASMAAAHQFYDTQRHSPLRRHMRRICFENSN